MIRASFVLIFLLSVSCGRQSSPGDTPVITVSIAPYKYFIEKIAGSDYSVNIMVPAGSDPHIYEPFPEQVSRLRQSVAYVSNGFLEYEMIWLDRFYEVNSEMKRLSLGDYIEPLASGHHHDGEHHETADPHYWVSPKCAAVIAETVKDFLCDLNPAGKEDYEANYLKLDSIIAGIDKKAEELFSGFKNNSFMIFHPNLGYLARDYGLEEITVEYEGKEPPPSRMRELIDIAAKENIRYIFVQKEYDARNAKTIADQVGAGIVIIDPLSEDWESATLDIIYSLHKGFSQSLK